MALAPERLSHDKLLPKVIEFRHDLHRHPELMYEEVRTSKKVQEWLKDHEIEFIADLAGGTGVLGFLPATIDKPEATIALRADMDALPIHEATEAIYSSKTPGIMHACGHDGHTSILAGTAAKLAGLKERRNNALFLFQPAEEGGAGGKKMVDEGCLNGTLFKHPADAIFGLHGFSFLPVGHVSTRDGAMMASASTFHIEVRGKGGHAAAPHMGIDPIVIAAQIIVAIQTVASRGVDPLDSVVVSVPVIRGGSAHNVIPDKVELEGTLRTLNNKTTEFAQNRLKEIVHGVAHAMGGEATLEFVGIPYPVTSNDVRAAAHFRKVISSVPTVELAPDCVPVMGGEDFSFYGESGVPACFYWLGLQEGTAPYPNVHTPTFDFNDRAIEVGIDAMVALATAPLIL